MAPHIGAWTALEHPAGCMLYLTDGRSSLTSDSCRPSLALQYGATELHLHGMGATTSIKREAAAKGIKAHIYWPSITTKIAAYVRPKKSDPAHPMDHAVSPVLPH